MSNLTHGKRKRRAESPARRFSILKKSERPGVFWGCYRALWRSIGEAKKPVIIEITGFFGAGNVTRTHDLLITK